ncbi:ArsR/SmtB family transcription factor [Cohaesibacter gelatinilyticus]|uniref:Transcriptional regulator, ArsR family n=1 Tax=Cohaesibacter gelatinilyticus TaxID=372072 RepID=A0A285PB71_9HYPH|nr:metalloregulator ArsR/SmtB family transcription factor [Cohaesibacter gelatinilyticus]SNZ18972.1 transcriptional regulator, ArsR family [Cohaesibacter gelatinilyticus]
MDEKKALTAFSALSQQTRLQVFRLLIKAGHQGLLAGDIATRLDVRQNTMSTNLSILTQAALIRNEREGRTIRYYANMSGIQHLLDFLLLDCCGGKAEECKPLVQALCGPD